MDPTAILITGGAGFVGASIAIHLKEAAPARRVIALDNLKRRGSELGLARLRAAGVEFLHGDVRTPEDLEPAGDAELVVECSAEPSVLAGLGASPEYVLRTNLVGTLNVLEYCRRRQSALLFLSTSRVYPIAPLRALPLVETATRFELAASGLPAGITPRGLAETFPLAGARSIYGATKLASELFVEEYAAAYGLRAVVDRCGVIAGPWQMGKVDQGVVALWVAAHVYGRPLRYVGFGGSGKQVRDVLHVDDLSELVARQIAGLETLAGATFNVGGGRAVSFSLLELTALCRAVSERTIEIGAEPATRAADVPLYLSDCGKLAAALGSWKPARDVATIVADTHAWIRAHERALAPIFAG